MQASGLLFVRTLFNFYIRNFALAFSELCNLLKCQYTLLLTPCVKVFC